MSKPTFREQAYHENRFLLNIVLTTAIQVILEEGWVTSDSSKAKLNGLSGAINALTRPSTEYVAKTRFKDANRVSGQANTSNDKPDSEGSE